MLRWLSPVVSWSVVTLLATATTAGLVARFLTPDDAPYLLVSREVAARPVVALLILGTVLALYAALFGWLCRLLDRWRDGVARAPSSAAPARFAMLVDHLFARWWRISIALAVVWLPFYLTSFPGQPSPDAANMFTEFLQTRADFAERPDLASADLTAPYEDYPTSSYLLPDNDSLWSNHHPLYLMLGYGAICWASVQLFASLVPAVVVISAVSAAFTLVAFGRALSLLGRLVPGRRHRGIALVVVAATPMIALWSMAIHKNQLFCAAFVWWLSLIARFLHGTEPVGRRWYVETAAVSIVMAISVQFGWIVLVVQAAAMVFVKRQRFAGLVAIGVPAVLVYGTIALVSAGGAVIASDPIETKGLQLQELALILTEHPDALTAQERDDLSRIFDLDAMVASFDPSSSDPLKSTGPLERKTDSFRYQSVTAADWDRFDAIVLDVVARHRATAVDGLFLKSYRYLDPLDEGTDWYPPWSEGYERAVDGHQVAPIEFNRAARSTVRDAAWDCYGFLPCRPILTHNVKTVAIVLLLAAAIAVRRRFAWLWALPFALQLAIAGVSPLSAGGRYVLGFTYALGVVVLLLAIDDRRSPDRTARRATSMRTPSGSR